MSKHPLVVFLPSGLRGRFEAGTPLLTAARTLGVDLDSVCGGRAMCGRCQIEVAEGEFAKHAIRSEAGNLSPVNEAERACATKRGLGDRRRLACQATIGGDLVIDVPPEAQIHRQVIVKETSNRPITIAPVTRLHYVEVDTATPKAFVAALAEQWGITDPVLDAPLPDATPKATFAIRGGTHVVASWPDYHDRIFGLSVDVGSTTLAAQLSDLETGVVLAEGGAMNPQIRFGEDVMSRVSYVMMNPDAAGELTRVVRDAINTLARDLASRAGVEPTDILEITAVGNPIMHHLLLGLDPRPLGEAPFPLQLEGAAHRSARDLGLDVNPGAEVYLLPCIAGHVGADTAAVILAEEPHKSEAVVLIADVGTNAEIVLGNRDLLLAASSPTGPAFEGAEISSGQRAAPGAIERVRIDPETLEPRIRVVGCDLWSDDPGFAEATKATGVTGICGSGIIEALAEMLLAKLMTTDGIIDGTMADRTDRIEANERTFSYRLTGEAGQDSAITVTQRDVRAIQLAKAALYAGARLLMEKMGVTQVDRIVLAGAFGTRIDPLHAMILGMIPDCALDNVVAVGNAAGFGARIALLNHDARMEIEDVVRRVKKIETALEPAFQGHFVGAMAFPHKTERFPHLERVAALPERPANDGPRRRTRRT